MQYIDFNEIKELTTNNWHNILTSIGLPSNSLTNRHQPCPACGGKDRFRFDNKDGSGSFICTHFNNGAGDGFGLVMHYFDCDFKTAINAIKQVLGLTNNQAISLMPKPNKTLLSKPIIKNQTDKILQLWNQSSPLVESNLAMSYFASRGLNPDCIASDNLRFHQGTEYWYRDMSGKLICAGVYPAIVAAFKNVNQNIQGLHFTMLQSLKKAQKLYLKHPETQQPLPAKKMRSCFEGSLKGCAIQIHQPSTRLMVTEGIENALAAHELNGWQVWACGSANGLKNLILPDGITELLIIADNDPNQVGIKAAESLARRSTIQGIKTKVWLPSEINTDVLDVLNQRKRYVH
jgi:putative DNA primase/helicase